MKYLLLEDCMNDMAMIRTTFETLDLFAATDTIRTEMREIVHEARLNFTRRLREVHETMQTSPETLKVDYDKVRACGLDMMMRGCPGRNLNRIMKVRVFDEGESSLYYFPVAGLIDLEVVRALPAPRFLLLLLNEVLQSAQNDDNYVDKQTLDAQVFRKYLALMFLIYAATDPMFYRINR